MKALRIALVAAPASVLILFGLFDTDARGQVRAAGKSDKSAALFMRMMPVLSSPRCMNCHTPTNFPRQGDDRLPHRMLIVRGPDNHGNPALQCQACHLNSNSPDTGVPGVPDWHMAPLSMNWEGLSPGVLCRTILDPEKTGSPAIETMVAHMETPLVKWAWSPGVNVSGKQRSPPPMPNQVFMGLVKDWVASGASCPQI